VDEELVGDQVDENGVGHQVDENGLWRQVELLAASKNPMYGFKKLAYSDSTSKVHIH